MAAGDKLQAVCSSNRSSPFATGACFDSCCAKFWSWNTATQGMDFQQPDAINFRPANIANDAAHHSVLEI